MTMDAPAIKAAILSKLIAAVDLSAVKKWLKAEPIPTQYPTSPFGWVEYNGGPRKPSAGTKEVFDDFFVVIVVKSGKPDENEDSAMALLLLALGGLTVLGVVLFFLPLYEIHVKMMKEKQAAEKALRTRLRQVVETLESSKESTCEVTDLLAFQLLEQKVARISEWPFDTATLSWLSAIIISVLGAIITRYFLSFIGS